MRFPDGSDIAYDEEGHPDAPGFGRSHMTSTEIAIQAVRADERSRMADLLDQHAGIIAEFAGDKEKVVELIALMLRLGGLSPSVAQLANKKATT